MGVIKINGVTYGGGDNSVMLTQAEYDALVDAGTVDPTVLYMITDRNLGSTPYAAGVIYDNTDTSLTATNVQDAIDEIADDVGSLDSGKMDATNPVGTGTFSMNRRSGTTIGQYSTTLGANCTASGTCSFAHGGSIASNNYAHSEGYSTTASGIQSHAEGDNSIASGNSAHAEGKYTTASGSYSHTLGIYTTANHKSQFVFGEFNVADASTEAATARGNYIEIVGNGTSSSAKSNARTLDWSGNETLSGNIEASGFGTTLLNLIYPVGSIYISVNNVNPGTYLTGTTWEAFGSGRTLVGVDTSDTDFDTVEETGGAKSHSYTPAGSNAAVTLTAAQSGVPSHAHTYTRPTVSSSGAVTNGITGGSHSHTTKVRLMNGGSSTSTGYYGAPYQMYTGQVYDKAGGVTSFGDTTVLSVQNATHSHNLPNHSHTLTGGGVSNNTASDASQAHTNLQPYITTYMYKRIA